MKDPYIQYGGNKPFLDFEIKELDEEQCCTPMNQPVDN